MKETRENVTVPVKNAWAFTGNELNRFNTQKTKATANLPAPAQGSHTLLPWLLQLLASVILLSQSDT